MIKPLYKHENKIQKDFEAITMNANREKRKLKVLNKKIKDLDKQLRKIK